MVEPTVSVVIPAYNRAHLLGRAINSVMSQTLDDWELLVVDDGSTDNTEEVVSAFQDPRVKYLRHVSNRGATAARNTGIKAAVGEFVGFLDSDDEWLPQKLEAQVAIFQENPGKYPNLGVVLTGTKAIDGRTGQIREGTPRFHGNVYHVPFRESLNGNCTLLVRRDCFDEVGYFDEGLPASQLWDMVVRLARKYEFDAVPDKLVVTHRNHGDHVRTSGNKARAYEMLLAKYDKGIPNRRRFRAGLMRYVGVDHWRRGNRNMAARYLWGALVLRPSPRTAWYFLRSLSAGVKWRAKAEPAEDVSRPA